MLMAQQCLFISFDGQIKSQFLLKLRYAGSAQSQWDVIGGEVQTKPAPYFTLKLKSK